MNHTNCLIQESHCGRVEGVPVCPKCGLDDRIRYVSEDAVEQARLQAKMMYREQCAAELRSKSCQQAERADVEYQPGEVFVDFPLGPQMVVIPRGSFHMGTSSEDPQGREDERPQHNVDFPHAFAIGRFPVTFAQWDHCLNDNGVTHNPYDKGWGRLQRPVINVSWHDALAYVAWLNAKVGLADSDPRRYRLPTEAEWEYACRAGTKSAFCTPSGSLGSLDATFDGRGHSKKEQPSFVATLKSHTKTTPVGSNAANPWGLHDMHGNVLEWVQDCYVKGYEGAPSDGSAVQSKCAARVLRGGCWHFSDQFSRSAARNWNAPGIRNEFCGFRVAKGLL